MTREFSCTLSHTASAFKTHDTHETLEGILASCGLQGITEILLVLSYACLLATWYK